MLNISHIKQSMTVLGLSGSKLAEACEVSKEAVSNWLAGESFPRPKKLPLLAKALNVTVESLLAVDELDELDEPVLAYRTKDNRPVSGASLEAAQEVARHLRQLSPEIDPRVDFEPPRLKEPVVNEAYIRRAAATVRENLSVAPTGKLTNKHLVELFHSFGAILVPVLWGLDKERHENALSVYLPESKSSWVVFNLGCREDDFKYWLAHEYGHCLSLHKLREQEGEQFAELFAQYLLFPNEAAQECLDEMRKSSGKPMAIAEKVAKHKEISIVTVLKGVDRLLEEQGEKPTGLLDQRFWAGWQANRKRKSTITRKIFGTDTPSPADYIVECEKLFGTPVFKALAKLQREEGGRNPAFIAATLKVGLGDAVGLSHALWQRQD